VTRRLAGALFAIVAMSVPLVAHHSIAGVYDTTASTTVEGVISEFHFVNPHPYLIVRVSDTGRAAEPWHLEMDNLGELAAVGLTAKTIQPGDRVVVTGNPSRSQARDLYLRKLVRSEDGFELEQVNNSPRIRRTVAGGR